MTARLMFIAATALSVSAAAVAGDPAKPDLRDVSAAQPQREIVLASVETKAPAVVAEAQAQAPVKRRVARVTTCRCGDPQPAETEAQ